MVQRKVTCSKNALLDLIEIMDYYFKRNKSKNYSQILSNETKIKLKTIDFSITFPQKTSVENLYYFTYNHVSICFEIENNNNNIKVVLLIDDRRNPDLIKKLLNLSE